LHPNTAPKKIGQPMMEISVPCRYPDYAVFTGGHIRMDEARHKNYCTIDHANKRRELAQLTPYQFWLRQTARKKVDPAAGRDRNTGTFHTGPISAR
jgi:hypothetical protein